ncbi:hypothetical protein [Streptomyces avicenniae]|uniref:hypothetical protein n=1 Tax=Streptomyces avicenniae TaxID=500153 RepID=UPI000699B43D|nr:hypothetical protein [Streptomyces avicenniae]
MASHRADATFRADDETHATTLHPEVREVRDLALVVGRAPDVPLADADAFAVEAGRPDESRPW